MLKKYSSYNNTVRAKAGFLFFICFFLLISYHAIGQVQPYEQIQTQVQVYHENALQEKMYVHTDKSFYIAGEICWFKLYNVDAVFNRPIDISKVAYVEVLDNNNKPVLQAKIALKKGDGSGSFYLPFTLNSGKYNFRAYTNWMKNFGAGYFFEKTITIINGRKVYAPATVPRQEKFDIAFYPEGGNLVNGIQSKIAFRAVNQYGKSVDFEGLIIDDHSDTIVKFSPLRYGIGNFLFTPVAGRTYSAIVKLPGNTQLRKELPAAFNEGYVMQVTNAGNGQAKITVQASATNNFSAVYLVAHTRGIVKIAAGGKIQNGRTEFILDTDKLGEGISHFTIFNDQRQPVCERLYFKYPTHHLQIEAVSNQVVYDQRKKISVQIRSASQDGKPVPADLSMAVYRIDSLYNTDETDITSYLLLSSDLTGTVESPGSYFSNDNVSTPEAMDNLMLSHGWRRFRWEDVLQNKKPSFQFLPEFNGHIIQGRIVENGKEKPGVDIKGYLSVPSTQTMFRTATSDHQGRVKFDVRNFYGKQEIIIQTNPEEDSTYRIDIENPFFDKYSAKTLPEFSIPDKNAGTLLNHYVGTEVQTSFSADKLQQFEPQKIDTSSFYVKPDVTYMLDNYVRFTTMEEVLREYVWPVNVVNKGGRFSLHTFNDNEKTVFQSDPLVLLDGVPVFNVTKFMTYDPVNIRKLEVVTRTYYYGKVAFDGIINIISYAGNLPNYQLDPHATVIDYPGLQLQREFFSPVYENEQQALSRMPDFRNLLFWSPAVKTNAQGNQDINFYSSDVPGKYAIVLQGLTEDGKTGSKVVMFDVKENK